MNLKHIFSATLVMLIFLGCSSENESNNEIPEEQVNEETEETEEPSPTEQIVYFTYQNFGAGGSENWIIIHDENGTLIDFKDTRNLFSVDFETRAEEVPGEIMVTKLSFSSDAAGNSLYHRVTTFTDLEIGSIWEDRPNSFEGNLIGNFNFQVDNISGVENILITTPNGILRTGIPQDGEFSATTLRLEDIRLYEGQEYMVSLRDDNGTTKYYLIMPENGMDYVYDFANFEVIDDPFELELPPNNFMLLFTGGIKGDDTNTHWGYGHRFNEYIGFSGGVFNLGYNDGYDRYRFGLTLTREDFTYSLQSIGDRIKAPTIPDRPSFTLESSDIFDFRYSSEINAITKNTRHESIVVDEQGRYLSTVWLVYSRGSETQKIGRLPNELIEKYPEMNVDALELKAISLFTQSYQQQELFEAETSKRRTGNHTSESFTFRNFQ